ncbi:MAG: methionine gamma-lyase family protein [Vulcanimicrobiaceae bacterium]
MNPVEILCREFGIGERLSRAALQAYARVAGITYDAQTQVKANVLQAFAQEGVSESDLSVSMGYGYDDPARMHYEALLARIFGVPKALARLNFASGTHAIVAALRACLRSGETLLSVCGPPYDTLRNAIVDAPYALVREGVRYREIALSADGRIDESALVRELGDGVAVVFVQRSRGYAPRRSLPVAAIAGLVAVVKARSPRTLILVDNCYGELVEAQEPTHAGADLAMGSLIKNLGGGLAPAGGYVVGRSDLLEAVAAQLYAPGLGDAVGPTLGFGRALIQGLFLAPLVVEQALRGLDFAAALFDELGFAVDPAPGAVRTDIVQAIGLREPALVIAFARGLQRAMPINARFAPEPGSVPGYADPVIMSSGAFVAGATIELSCDAPLRAPYEVYLQGGVVAEQAYLGALYAAQAVLG